MPIAKRTVRCNFDYVDNHTFITNEPQTSFHIFQNSNVASMVGTIQQLSLLADYASEIFQDLQNDFEYTNKRIMNVTTRTRVVTSQLTSVRKEVMSKERHCTDLIPFKQNEADINTKMLAVGTRPHAMQMHYSSQIMIKMPTVKEMDIYLTPEELDVKGSCTTLYSNPNFFLFEWMKLEEAKIAQKSEEKRLRKIERQERRAKLRAERDRKSTIRNSSMSEKKKGLNWRER
jgi:hypothetical protein